MGTKPSRESLIEREETIEKKVDNFPDIIDSFARAQEAITSKRQREADLPDRIGLLGSTQNTLKHMNDYYSDQNIEKLTGVDAIGERTSRNLEELTELLRVRLTQTINMRSDIERHEGNMIYYEEKLREQVLGLATTIEYIPISSSPESEVIAFTRRNLSEEDYQEPTREELFVIKQSEDSIYDAITKTIGSRNLAVFHKINDAERVLQELFVGEYLPQLFKAKGTLTENPILRNLLIQKGIDLDQIQTIDALVKTIQEDDPSLNQTLRNASKKIGSQLQTPPEITNIEDEKTHLIEILGKLKQIEDTYQTKFEEERNSLAQNTRDIEELLSVARDDIDTDQAMWRLKKQLMEAEEAIEIRDSTQKIVRFIGGLKDLAKKTAQSKVPYKGDTATLDGFILGGLIDQRGRVRGTLQNEYVQHGLDLFNAINNNYILSKEILGKNSVHNLARGLTLDEFSRSIQRRVKADRKTDNVQITIENQLIDFISLPRFIEKNQVERPNTKRVIILGYTVFMKNPQTY